MTAPGDVGDRGDLAGRDAMDDRPAGRRTSVASSLGGLLGIAIRLVDGRVRALAPRRGDPGVIDLAQPGWAGSVVHTPVVS